ncbi:hypothetical protein OPKNFCMD_5102 [Methylobacterium crusticola]|uniref:Glycosyltransferase 2-like domain-containing protein n=1 Tax=Methylobacterium crusticola TaxID=1697972 RepID=A0ABQ4R4H1_9HYPH|nr:glycosyltransferase family 2 protein [Methylobacterium crusticola]GJD52337.1 hypothetical protein OPKNFCMD_5102 [Methylobacterium crusticola]
MFVPASPLRGAALALPPELAFLVGDGVPPEILLIAARVARREGSDPVTALLRTGLMDEEAYYAALARALGVPYRGAGLALGPGVRFPDDLVADAAPAPEGGLVVAPQGRAVAALLAEPRRAVAVTAPGHLRAAVMRARGPEAAAHAAEDLGIRAPEWAYRPGMRPAQWLALWLGLAALPLLLDAPEGVQLAALAAGAVAMLAVLVFRLTAVLTRGAPAPAPDPGRVPDAALPVYTVMVALHREARVVPRLVEALAGLDYPATKLDLKLVIEADDRETAAAIAAVAPPHRFEVVTVPPGLPRTKPRALNLALPLARGRYLVVYDAEDVPDPGQLRAAAALFAAAPLRTACLQGRLVIDNTRDSWLTRCFTLEYAALFDVLLPALAAWMLPVPLGGTTTHFRTETLRALHGWDAWNVTEDADLGMRLALAGYHVGDLQLSTLEEAPARLGPWLRQRTRWMKGFLQTAITHGRDPRDSLRRLGPLGLLCAVAMVPGTLLSALAYPVLMALAAWRFLAAPLPAAPTLPENMPAALGLLVFGSGLGAMLLPAILGCCRRGWWSLLPWVALLPFYYGLVSLAACLGIVELIVAPARWNKTEHGLAVTSRSGALGPAGAPP